MKIIKPNIFTLIILLLILGSVFMCGYLTGKSPSCEEITIVAPVEKDTVFIAFKQRHDSTYLVEFKELPIETQNYYRHLIDSLTPWTNER